LTHVRVLEVEGLSIFCSWSFCTWSSCIKTPFVETRPRSLGGGKQKLYLSRILS
jgi:hypothetical protein